MRRCMYQLQSRYDYHLLNVVQVEGRALAGDLAARLLRRRFPFAGEFLRFSDLCRCHESSGFVAISIPSLWCCAADKVNHMSA